MICHAPCVCASVYVCVPVLRVLLQPAVTHAQKDQGHHRAARTQAVGQHAAAAGACAAAPQDAPGTAAAAARSPAADTRAAGTPVARRRAADTAAAAARAAAGTRPAVPEVALPAAGTGTSAHPVPAVAVGGLVQTVAQVACLGRVVEAYLGQEGRGV